MIAKTLQLRTAFALAALTCLASGAAAGATLTVGGQVDDAGDGTSVQGTTWQLYDAADSTLKVTGLVGALQANTWLGEAGHFLGPLAVGDELLMMAETEADPGLQTHAGYYAVTNHVLDGQDPAAFTTATLRAIPAPDVQLEPGYTAQLSWPTPTEDTSSAGIIGYRIHRSEDGITFAQITASPVIGNFYTDVGFPSTTAYYAISLVYRGAPVVESTIISANSNYMQDTDGDALDDNFEDSIGTDYNNPDSDGDGLSDYEEITYYDGDPSSYTPGVDTDPLNPDTDNDGVQDGSDALPLDPTEQLDTDQDGIGNNADLDDDNDGYTDVDELAVYSDPLDYLDVPPLHAPVKPVVTEPAGGLVVDATYEFGFNAFDDIDIPKGDSLERVQWKVVNTGSLDSILDRTLFQSHVVTSLEMPVDINMLESNTEYGIALRHGDSTGLWSEWSDEVVFSVSADLGEITDTDANGVEDAQQVNGFADTNGNLVDDTSEGISVIQDAEQGMYTGILTDNGAIQDLNSVSIDAVYDNSAMIGSVPYGLYSYKVTGLTSTAQNPAIVAVTFYYTGAIPVDAGWLRHDTVTGRLVNLTNLAVFSSGNVTVTLTDGSADDLDGVVNGVIVGFGGIAVLADDDADTVVNFDDNCLNVSNSSQRDTDGDGFGNMCDADIDNNERVNATDLAIFITRFRSSDPNADFNGDGRVNATDLAILKTLFRKPPGPSGLVP